MLRKIILTAASLLILLVFYLLPANRSWVDDKIFPYYNEFQSQSSNLDIEARKEMRYRNDYRYSKKIADFFDTKGMKKEVLVLIPPTEYFKSKGIQFHVPEPAVVYYYTGLKTVWVNSKEAVNANWFVH